MFSFCFNFLLPSLRDSCLVSPFSVLRVTANHRLLYCELLVYPLVFLFFGYLALADDNFYGTITVGNSLYAT